MTRFAFLAAAAALSLRAGAVQDAGPIALEKGARVVLMGNGLGARLVHAGHFETELHLRHPAHRLVVRNMCDEGNTPSFRPHSGRKHQLGFPGAEKFAGAYCDNRIHGGEGFFETEEQWLARLKPDVLVCFFGFNESFQGLAGLEPYRAELDAFLAHTLAQKYNGTAVPRLALVGPTAIQDLSASMDVPDGKAQNPVLAAYSGVMEAVARRHGILFVDAFHASQAWYRGTKEPLTADGALLNDAGNRKLAELLNDRLFGAGRPAAEAEARRAKVREAVLEKDWLWINDFKIPNGVHVFGRRHNPFGPANYPFELEKIRQMTEIRDQAIWAALEGGTLDVAALDAKTRPLPPVETNFKKPVKFLYGEEALATIQVPAGYRIDQWATEKEFPDLANPVQMSFDNRGRLWVATMPSYPHWRPGDPRPDDKLLILEDTDGNGKADKQTVFADKLHLPMGFEFAPEGVYVSQGINLVLLRDANGDDRADSMEIVFSGFDDHDTHHAISAYCADESGAIFMCEGVFLRTSVETPYGPVRGTDGGFFRFAPQRRHLERHAQLSIPNPWGVAFDDWGQHFFLYTSSPDTEWMLPGSVKPRYGSANPKSANLIEPAHRVRPTSGVEFVSSRHFPDEVQGDMLINNNIGFLGCKQHRVVEDGTGYRTQWRHDLYKSSDPNFRPVDMEFAPDGSLYVVDWHNPLIGHMQHNARDPHRDHAHGRIYRVTYPAKPLVTPAPVHGASIAQLLENLKLPEYRARYRSRRELRGRKPEEVLAGLATWLDGLSKTDPAYEHHLLEALWVTWGLNRVDEALLQRLLESKDYRARAAAVRVLRYSGHRIADQAERLAKAARDAHGRVKLEAVVAASWIGKEAGLAVIAAAEAETAASAPAGPAFAEVSEGGRLIRVKHPEIAAGKVDKITMTVPGSKATLNLAEMEILAGGKNVVRQAKLSQSSEYNKGQFPVAHLVDGNKDTFSHTDFQKDPWLAVEFPKPVSIDEVRIWNRPGFEDRFNGAVVVFHASLKTLATVEVRLSGAAGGSAVSNDPWIRDALRTAKAHLNNETVEEVSAVKAPAHLKGAAREQFLKGAEIYAREGHCGQCHQPDGEGLELSGFPPISKSPWIEDETRLIKLTLHGMMGPIEVKGKTYPGLTPMTPFGGMLSDEEVAAVLTFVRNSFGNKAEPVAPATVKEVRAATKDRVGFYTAEELLNPGAPPKPADPNARAFVKMWAIDDFKGAFDAPLKGRDFARGKAMFEVAGCVKCHNVQGKGANVGADLSKAADEYKGAELLRHILEPSARIRDEHRVVGVLLKDDRRFKGMIVRREADAIHIAENLQEPDKTVAVKTADVARMVPSDLSPMPTGLLVMLKRDEILDLVAFLAAKGDPSHPAFK